MDTMDIFMIDCDMYQYLKIPADKFFKFLAHNACASFSSNWTLAV